MGEREREERVKSDRVKMSWEKTERERGSEGGRDGV